MTTLEYAHQCLSQCAVRFAMPYNEILMAASLQPVPAPRMTAADRWKKRPCVVRYLDFKTALRNQASKQGIEVLPELLNVLFVLPLPKSISKNEADKRRYNYHKQRPDRDNMLKAVQDAFAGDDSHCADGRTTKIWGDLPMVIFYK